MRSKTIFTTSEIALIEKLIEEKLKATSEKQISIRNRIRNLGFYWEDFHEKGKVKYNIENFRKLISNGILKIIAEQGNNTIKNIKVQSYPNNQTDLQNKDFKQGLEPWVGKNPKVLILGSMPGDISLKHKTYYANISHNSFWKIMYSLFPVLTHQNHKEYITSYKIALWDCVQSGIRTGSTDKNIDDYSIVPNDLKSFLNKYPSIESIVINGKGKPAQYYKRFFRDIRISRLIILNSTSNTCCKSFESKLQEWSILKDLVK